MGLRHQPHILHRNKGKTVRSIHRSTRGTLGGRASVVPRDGPSFIAVPDVGGGELVVQKHGGALKRWDG